MTRFTTFQKPENVLPFAKTSSRGKTKHMQNQISAFISGLVGSCSDIALAYSFLCKKNIKKKN